MEEVDVVSYIRVQFSNRGPLPPIHELCLHSPPKQPAHRIVINVADSSAAQSEAVFVDIAGEQPGG